MTPSARGLDAVLSALPLDEIDTDPTELAEALWLARYLPRVGNPVETGGQDPGAVRPAEPETAHRARNTESKVLLSLAELPACEPPEAVDGTGGADGDEAGDDFPIRVPYGKALPGQHLFLRALHDFRIPVRSGPPTELDVDATIRDAARNGYVMPRMRPRERLELSALCVLDACRSMVVWQRAAREFARTLADSGMFREVEVTHVTEDVPAALPPLYGPFGDGARVVFLISDGVGGLWSRPEFFDQLAAWARRGPLVVLNPLPEHLWDRTALHPAHGNLRALTPAPGNARMLARTYEPEDWLDDLDGFDDPDGVEGGPRAAVRRPRMPLPVLEFTPRALAAWAGFVRQPSARGFHCALATPRLVDPSGTHGTSGADAAPGADDVPGSGPGRPGERHQPEQGGPPPATAVDRFLASASTTAVRLAEHLSQLGGWMNLAIMRYIQDFAVPGSGATPLAEVLLSGLMVEQADGSRDAERRRYRFHEEALEILRRNLPFDARERTLGYIAGRIGRAYTASSPADGFSARAFTRAAAASDSSDGSGASTGSGGPGGRGEAVFAAAGLELAHQLRVEAPAATRPGAAPGAGPRTEADLLTARAETARARFLASGRMEDLDEAIGNRATAVGCSRDDERAEPLRLLAEEIEYRWLYSRDPRDRSRARECRDAALVAAGRPPAGAEDPEVPTAAGNHPLPTDVGQARMLLQNFEGDPGASERPAEHALFRFNLAVALSGRAGEPEPESSAAAEAIYLFQEATSMITENEVPLASWNRAAATRALELARAAGGPEALDWAVRLLRTTARHAPSDDAEGTLLLADLAAALHTRYNTRREPADLAEALLHLRTVTGRQAAAPGALPAERRALCLLELGRAFEDRYELDRQMSDLGEAAQSYRDAAGAARPARPDLRAESLVAWGRALYRLGRDDEALARLSEGVALFEQSGLPGPASLFEARRLLAELRGPVH